MHQTRGYLLINGQRVEDAEHNCFNIVNPATEEIIGKLIRATFDDISAAIASTKDGFDKWRRLSSQHRASVINGAAAEIRSRRDELAWHITAELGKPYHESLQDADGAAAMFEWASAECRRSYGRIVPGSQEERRIVLREPAGPVIAITPWNSPAITPARKLSYALAAGCSVLLKPSEETPSAALLIADALYNNGLPNGVLNILFGDPETITNNTIKSGEFAVISFTGSVPVGKTLYEAASRQMMSAVMELGGHAPVVVCDDASPDYVASKAVSGAFRNAGQVCLSPTRFLVHEKIYHTFVKYFTELSRAVRVGDPRRRDTQMGPLKNALQKQKMHDLVDDALQYGAEVLSGGEPIFETGFYWQPTILTNTSLDAAIENTEAFGPIVTVAPFADLNEAVNRANRLPYGLAAYVFSQSRGKVADFIQGIEAGVVGVNTWKVTNPETPFGGIKESGVGLEGGYEGIDAFQRIKYVADNYEMRDVF